ncbi:pyruvate kinase [Cryobacterium sp. TMT1-3]|uniref:pyruvate kinase n=1 Tax=Cryobacterium luteum TaxID=1424661 RepID=A0A1H8C840_9MICO|nr:MULTISPECIES: pyruvate kinase [Cryobacterium]TFB89291.1 pyruvate kinase [Cryobacterium luteum]TFC27399.1 pyruvate kinase [Cryobacterium sp. TMT1-3]SEM91361.1 pyruvate kinase [Cryobacterium luteum]
MTELEFSDLVSLQADVESLRAHLLLAEVRQADEILAVAARHTASATNLVHYVELRAHDLRDLQARLTNRGLTSLGRTESGVLASVDGLLRTLTLLIPQVGAVNPVYAPEVERPPDGSALLTHNAALLLGAQPAQRSTRIMVTLPSESATDAAMVASMLESGMDLARINCAHDGPTSWAAMIANIHSAEAATGERCRIAMDLGGPKLRTGPITPGPEVIKVKPIRSPTGAVQKRGLAWLGTRPDNAVALGAPVIPITDSSWLARRRVGDEIHLVDTRGAHRTLTVEQIFSDGCLVSLPQTVYFGPGLALAAARDERDVVAFVGTLNPTEQFLLVHRGDTLILTADLSPADVTTDGTHRIGCTLPSAFLEARPGERVMLDDGKIGGVIVAVAATEITVAVHHASLVGTKLRAEKGINLPDTHLSISALTEQDEADLDFVRAHADIVNMSFVRSADDVRDLLSHLKGNPELGIVLKIETVAAFEALPQILLEAMRWQGVGVMIARGDLAVEAGFERLAEVQEEILWLCESAHVPVIWATQVLDTLARTGLPSRAEVTDAAMAERAECVMLNKGPFIADAISMLAGILGRMQGHTDKKRSLLRRLRAWDLDAPDATATASPAGQASPQRS